MLGYTVFEYALYPLFIFAMLVSLYAEIKVTQTFRKYSRVKTRRGENAAMAARRILDREGLRHIGIERVGGSLTDHFDPRAGVLRLSQSVFGSSSCAAIGVAAHEAGHAIQHERGYFPIKLRSALVPITGFASRISWLVIFGGILLTLFAEAFELGYTLLLFGIALFSVTAIFQLVTLPCEFNASKRALVALTESGYYSEEELGAARKVLSAAALTYVAALFVTVMQLLRLLSLVFVMRGRRR